MKKLAFGALFVGLLSVGAAACGGGSDTPDANINLVDSATGPDAQTTECNLLTNQGCATGEKCTWIDVTADLGKIGCATDGTVAVGGACTTGQPGETTGFDNCVGGSYCLGGVCEAICSQSPDSCDPATSTCSSYAGLFDGAPVDLGVCDFLCNPGKQERRSDLAANCGVGAQGTPRGCYGYVWNSSANPRIDYACTPDISDAQVGQTPSPLTPDGNPYLNSCDAGYWPYVNNFAGDVTQVDICLAFCVPGESFQGSTANIGGLVGSGFTCADRGAVTTGTECRFQHIFDGTPDVALNTSGTCMVVGDYLADWDNDTNTPDTGIPSCGTLPQGDENNPDGNLIWGCAPWPAALTGKSGSAQHQMIARKLHQMYEQRSHR
ncbi:MAG: hypothetical protein H6709_10165 [Kofleriaceae bacterium]|nr:hypothetical protein [Kofleriaceae bacterium]MCB9572439.1 hypothetical protein [Kofleriaceae bacterium]